MRFTYATGQRTGWHRLFYEKGKPILVSPNAKTKYDESRNVQAHIEMAADEVRFRLREQGKLTPQEYRPKFNNYDALLDEYLKWFDAHRSPKEAKKKRSDAKILSAFFGQYELNDIKDTVVQKFVDAEVKKGYMYNTIRLHVTLGHATFTWMQKNKLWDRLNPFKGAMAYLHDEHIQNIIPPKPMVRNLDKDELSALWLVLQKPRYEFARIFWYVGLHSGLRPDEIFRLDAKDVDHRHLTLNYLRTKPYPQWRTIAIPKCLSVYLLNNQITYGKVCAFKETKAMELLKEACEVACIRIVTGFIVGAYNSKLFAFKSRTLN